MADFRQVYLRSTPTRDMCPEMGLLIGQALGREHRTVVLGMDYMKSSRMMRDAIVAGLLSTGVNVLDVGYVPAPVMGSMARLGDCAVYVTEYHEYGFISGYMLMNKDGGLFDKNAIQALNSVIEYGPHLVDSMAVGHVTPLSDCIEDYNDRVIGDFVLNRGCSVILDCSCGCCALSAPTILNAIGSELVTINAQRDNNFYTEPNVTIAESELRNLKHFIGNYSGYVGLSLNRIGTQLDLVDEKGMDVPFDIMASIIIRYVRPSCIVVPFDSSRIFEDALMGRLPEINKELIEEEADDTAESCELDEGPRIIYCEHDIGMVSNIMVENGAELGFCDGCVMFGRDCVTPDAIRTSALISQIARDNNINNINEATVRYFEEDAECLFECRVDDFTDSLNESMTRYESWEVGKFKDGWRFDLKDGWGSIRFTENEDSVLVSAGSKDRAYLIGLMDVLKDLVSICSIVK